MKFYNMNAIEEIKQQGAKLGACKALQQCCTVTDLCNLLKTPQGQEFATAHNFPSLNLLRGVSQFELIVNNVFLNAGAIVINNPKNIVIIGNTTAVINVTEPTTLHNITALQGAKAIINAQNFAVVAVSNSSDCSITNNATNNALILQ